MSAHSLVFRFLVSVLIAFTVTQSLLETSIARLKCPYSGIFSDRETLELSTDPCKITGFAKLYHSALVTSCHQICL